MEELASIAVPPASVLLVDDHAPNLLALEAVLGPLDVRLVRANSGREALDHLLREDFAAILLDVQMPDMDGFETAAVIRGRERTRQIPILFVTAVHFDEAHQSRGYAHGAVDYVAKPFNPDVLRAKVASLVELWRRGESLRRREAAVFDRERADLAARERAARREAEAVAADLRRRELELRLIVDGVKDHAISMLDTEGRVITFNAPAERIKGYTLAEVRGQSFAMFFTDEDRAAGVPERELATARAHGTYEGEGLRRRKDGTLFYAAVSLSALRDASGELVGFVKVTQDISERRRAAEERERLLASEQAARREADAMAAQLRQNEERFRTLADTMPLLAWYAEPDGSITWYNRRWHEYTGLSLAEQQGWRWQSVHEPDAIARVIAKWKHAVATGEPFEDEFRLRRHDGALRWFLTRALPLRDDAGRIVRWFGTNVDIDDQKRAEMAARFLAEATTVFASSLDYQATLARVAEIAVPTMADWAVVDMRAPDGAIERLAISHRDPAKLHLAREIWRRWPPAPDEVGGIPEVLRTGRAQLLEDIPDAMLEAGIADPEQLAMMRQLGLRSSMSLPLFVRGETVGVLSFIVSESGRRFGPADLAMAEELARRAGIAIENAQLFELAQRERRSAEDANRAKDLFLSTLSHELRTPLNAIVGWTRMLVTGAVSPDKREKALATIDRNARTQVALIEDILDLSRIVTGKMKLDVSPVELAQVVEASLESVRPAADAKGVRLQAVLDPDAGLVMGDPNRLQQIVWNLVNNAIKFTPRGGRVHVLLRRDGSHVVVTVSDTGQGISGEFLPHVWERFKQADSTSTRVHGGLGLGLAIVKHLVEMHGGTVTAESAGEDRGASFTVRVPIASVRASAPGQPLDTLPVFRSVAELSCPPELAGLRVLVVDDEEDSRELVAGVLEHCKARATRVANAADALEAVRTGSFDVLVSDVGMPGEDGLTLIRRIRALPEAEGGRVPAVALTAYARLEDRTRSLVAGFNNHVGKPVDVQELVLVVANLAGRFARTSSPSSS